MAWYFLTADYAFGYSLEEQTSKFVESKGGKVLGSVRHPLATTDYSSFLPQAQASPAPRWSALPMQVSMAVQRHQAGG